jgi:hypothetical protein
MRRGRVYGGIGVLGLGIVGLYIALTWITGYDYFYGRWDGIHNVPIWYSILLLFIFVTGFALLVSGLMPKRERINYY